MNDVKTGKLLLANPHLDDPNFIRSVIFLCEHNDEGSFGFVLNKKTSFLLHELIPEMRIQNIAVYEGGPVELNTLHFIHQCPEKIEGGKEVLEGVYWGGNFETLVNLINSNDIDPKKIKFFLGYSGWDEGQLETEMEENTWILSHADKRNLFATPYESLWRDVLKSLGGEYELLINAPIDPRLN